MKTVALFFLLLQILPALSEPATSPGATPPAPEYGSEEFYWQHAVKLYPDAQYKDTEFFREMVKIAAWLEQNKDPVLALPDKKLRIAHMTAAKLGVLARVTAAPPSSPPRPAPPKTEFGEMQVNPPELLAMIQEEKAATSGKKWVGKGSSRRAVYVDGKWGGKTEEQLIEACVTRCRKMYGGEPVYVQGAPVGKAYAKDPKLGDLKKAVEGK